MGQRAAGWLGTRWTGTPEEVSIIEQAIDRAVVWSNANHIPLIRGSLAQSRMRMQPYDKHGPRRSSGLRKHAISAGSIGIYVRILGFTIARMGMG